jgi:hypothetical protein
MNILDLFSCRACGLEKQGMYFPLSQLKLGSKTCSTCKMKMSENQEHIKLRKYFRNSKGSNFHFGRMK